jgi:hypothetical protein
MRISLRFCLVALLIASGIFLIGCPVEDPPDSPPYAGTWRATNVPVDLGSGPVNYDLEVVLTATSWRIGLFTPGSGYTGFQDYSCLGTHTGLQESSGAPTWNDLEMAQVWLFGGWMNFSSTVYGAIELSVGGDSLYFWYDNDSDHITSINAEGTLLKQ